MGSVTGGIYYRCTKYGCYKRFPCLRFSRFPKTKLTAGQLHDVISRYSNLDRVLPPSIDDLAADCGGGKVQVAAVVGALRAAEVSKAKADNGRGRLSGSCEIDEHGVRFFYVSHNSC